MVFNIFLEIKFGAFAPGIKTVPIIRCDFSICSFIVKESENGKVLGWGDYTTYDPNHQYGFYSNCNEVSGCQGDLDDCGNCQPPIVDDEEEEEDEDKTLTPKCCGENLYLIDDDGNVIDEGGK